MLDSACNSSLKKKKLDKLNPRYAFLLAAHDELIFTVRGNLEADRMMRIGCKGHQFFHFRS